MANSHDFLFGKGNITIPWRRKSIDLDKNEYLCWPLGKHNECTYNLPCAAQSRGQSCCFVSRFFRYPQLRLQPGNGTN